MSDGSFLTAESDQLVNCMPVLAGSLIGLSNDTVVQGPQALTITDPQNRSERWNETYPLYYTLLTCTFVASITKQDFGLIGFIKMTRFLSTIFPTVQIRPMSALIMSHISTEVLTPIPMAPICPARASAVTPIIAIIQLASL